MPDSDPVIAALHNPEATGRERLKGLVSIALYVAAKREHAALYPDADPIAYAASWTPSRLDGLKEQAGFLLNAEARRWAGKRFGRRAVLFRSALAGSATLAILAVTAIGGLRLLGIDVIGDLEQACVPEPPPRYVGRGR